ncbi:hypothetical protein GARCT_02564 [Geobacillus sp. 12AMOR1]|nr:hypothetical protein GARCT_02564 [Geobacillus sp. 12AMOR1]
MSEWLTTWEMLSRLKDGEIAVSDDEKVRVGKFGETIYYQVDRYGNYLCQITLTSSFVDRRWRILPRYVSFEEAMKAYAEGKTIRSYCNGESKTYNINDFDVLTINVERIRSGKWTIEEDK